MATKVMREIDHLDTDEYGYQVVVLVCGHRFTAHRPAASQQRRRIGGCNGASSVHASKEYGMHKPCEYNEQI